MCACEGSYVCSQCKGTPFDPNYEDDAVEPVTPMEFDAFVDQYRPQEDWPTRFWG